MAEAERIARDEGRIAIAVSFWASSANARAFYRGLGYDNWADRAGNFRKDLVPGTAAASYAARFPAGH